MTTKVLLSPQVGNACSMSAMDADPRLRRRVGARIRQVRHDRGLSQTALARLIDDTAVSGSYISRWERGENMPSWPNLQAVADALGVTVASLLKEDDDEPVARFALSHAAVDGRR